VTQRFSVACGLRLRPATCDLRHAACVRLSPDRTLQAFVTTSELSGVQETAPLIYFDRATLRCEMARCCTDNGLNDYTLLFSCH
jgi:hypothetical protein